MLTNFCVRTTILQRSKHFLNCQSLTPSRRNIDFCTTSTTVTPGQTVISRICSWIIQVTARVCTQVNSCPVYHNSGSRSLQLWTWIQSSWGNWCMFWLMVWSKQNWNLHTTKVLGMHANILWRCLLSVYLRLI